MAGISLSPEALRRVSQTVKRLEATPRNQHSGFPSAPLFDAAHTLIIRVTSTTPTSGRYPGRMQTGYDVTAKTWTEAGADDCWVVTHDASALSATRYFCRLMGILASDGKAVFLAEKPAHTKASFVRFSLPSALATTDASKASCTVDDFWGGSDPGSTVTVYNLPASTNYIFSGASGNKGLATYDEIDDKYWIVQLQCP